MELWKIRYLWSIVLVFHILMEIDSIQITTALMGKHYPLNYNVNLLSSPDLIKGFV